MKTFQISAKIGQTAAAIGLILLIGLTACSKEEAKPKYTDAQVEALMAQIKALTKNDSTVTANLKTFDELDFVVFSNQQWERLHESHDKNIKVVMPDGSVTLGLDAHIQTLKWLFLHAPDTKIKQHPIAIGSKDGVYTAVTGQMEGTFTKPLYLPNGTVVPPTGKSFKLPMVTIGIWKNGVMIEEQLYYDNQSYFSQLGIQ